MLHFLYRGSFEQTGQEIVSPVVAMKVEIHILVDGRQFITDGLVQKFNTFFFHVAWGFKLKFSPVLLPVSGCPIFLFGNKPPVNLKLDFLNKEAGDFFIPEILFQQSVQFFIPVITDPV